VADDLARLLGDERHPDVAAAPQRIHQAGFIVLPEGETVDVPDGDQVSGGFGMDQEANRFVFHIGNDLADLTGKPGYTG
jgi:hypothetical protein